mmetsp:Transcript_44900/g.108500  ORF Transcript_44900/g.108500 Transcript_44900/m.108500 type:complete len:107 (-) Transcript_44900:137-457(-)
MSEVQKHMTRLPIPWNDIQHTFHDDMAASREPIESMLFKANSLNCAKISVSSEEHVCVTSLIGASVYAQSVADASLIAHHQSLCAIKFASASKCSQEASRKRRMNR